MRMLRNIAAMAAVIATCAGTSAGTAWAAEVNVYSARNEQLIKPLFDGFTAQTGIRVNLLSAGEDQLLQRLKSEGAASPADVLLTTDVARLNQARLDGVLQRVVSPVLEQAVPSRYRDPQGYWFGLSARARVIFYAEGRVKAEELSTIQDLASPKWKGRLCVRSSSSVYNQSLLAGVIAVDGPDKAEAWARGIVANMARKPQGGDRDQITAIASGLCDVAIANTYYYAGMLASKRDEERQAAQSVALFWPNQKERGAPMNVSGAGITAAARHKAEALSLLEFLAGPEAQRIYAEINHEFPVNPAVPASGLVAKWGTFKAESIDVAVLGENNARAVRIFDRVGWR